MLTTTSLFPKSGDRMTLEEFRALNLPEESSLILLNGVVFDEDDAGSEMTRRSHRHARAELRIGRFLDEWLERTAIPATAFSGEVGCELPSQGFVGIDVAVFSNDIVAESDGNPYIAGVPLLAVEVLSMNDRQGAVSEKVTNYLAAGVKQVWVVDTHFKTIIIHQHSHVPEMFATGSSLSGGDTLPGLSISVADIFS